MQLQKRVDVVIDPYKHRAAYLRVLISMQNHSTHYLERCKRLHTYRYKGSTVIGATLTAYHIDNGYIFCDVPENIKMHLDLDRLGRDIRMEGTICYTSYGTVISYQ